MAKIFVRERNKIEPGDKQPRYAVVGVQGTDMNFFQFHMRKGELDVIAQSIGAELVTLPRGSDDHVGEAGAGGKRLKKTRKAAKKST